MQTDGLLKKINHWRYQLNPYIENIGLDIGLVDGYRDYTRFIILGRSRSGTNFLRGLLNSHSQIVVLGELFQSKKAIGWAYPGYMKSQKDLALFHEEPVRFLESRVFKRFPRRTSAVGFKIFYYHAQDDLWKPIWSYLVEQKNIKVIHNKRRNILRTHLSRKLAGMTDVWVNTGGDSQDSRRVTLDYDECLKDFTQTREWENTYDALFADHKKVEIFYEDLATDYVSEMQRLQAFLGVDIEEVKPETFKQSHQPLSRAITNYDELKERFAGSPWEPFFEDQG
jgi:LPS sulfotransferase NodH